MADENKLSVKDKMKIPRVGMREQDAKARGHYFTEVNLGYTEEMALTEASRCLMCKKPSCIGGCPVEVKIPDFIQKIVEHDYLGASAVIKETNVLGAVCGRVCPQEAQCEGACVLAKKGDSVAIGHLERFVSDYDREHGKPVEAPKVTKSGRRVAIVGSGPAGLTAASDLAKLGHEVVIFEALHAPGGVLIYGIPEFRLPKSILAFEIGNIRKLGVDIRLNHIIGKLYTIEELMNEEGFDAVFIGTGAGTPKMAKIPGENLVGVMSANEFLVRAILMAAATRRWTSPAPHCAWAPTRATSSTAAAARRCPPASRRSTTRSRRGSSSSC
jgi:glutamate synthase (NADPH/NADH) small chain